MTARIVHTLAIAAAAACYGTDAMAQVPAAVAAPGETTVATFQGEGAQIYQCKAGNDGHEWHLGVISGHGRSPLYPQKRTSLSAIAMSALCQKQTKCIAARKRTAQWSLF